MAIDWTEYFDKLVKGVDWTNVKKDIRDAAYKQVAKWIGGDEKTITKALKDALKDGKLSEKEVIGILSVVALDSVKDSSELGKSFAEDLLKTLADGELTGTEIGEVAANWVATRVTKNETLRDLLKAVVDGKLNKDKVEEALFKWLEERSGIPGLKDRVKKILNSAKPVNLRSVILLTASYLIKDGVLTKGGTTDEDYLKNLIAAIDKLGKSSLADVFDALADADYAEAARQVLDELGIDDDLGVINALVKMFLHAKPEQAIQDFLAGALERGIKGIKSDQAKALAKTLMDIVSGRVELIPKQTEAELYADELGWNSRDYNLWLEVRRIVYAAKMAIAGGPVVPTDAMARPHVFAAAAIEPESIVGSLVGESSWPLFLQYIRAFTMEVFKKEVHVGDFQKWPPLLMSDLQAKEDGLTMFTNVRRVLFP
jgi:hypothetical protein